MKLMYSSIKQKPKKKEKTSIPYSYYSVLLYIVLVISCLNVKYLYVQHVARFIGMVVLKQLLFIVQ